MKDHPLLKFSIGLEKKYFWQFLLADIASDVLELIAEKVDHKVELKRFSPQIRTLSGN